ncbi:tetratricopeptide repeat protein [Polaromonas sp. YR568]|uniref:O-linked N-acetylglucosamine transferase, SPINDLY family protein n=1 Tax=Polaromonas sp. YR568 TaxID=1855301 RepID=UPI0020C843E7|nr:tetratricopeptide repeat protein [Polaromonas sp. YR568]
MRTLEEGIAFESQGQIDRALHCYDLAIHLMPELARAHFHRGNILLDRGDAATALEAYEKAKVLKPDSAALHYNMGNALLRLGRVEAGIAACRQAISLKPEFVDAHVTLGLSLEELGKHQDAMACYRSALEIDPHSAAAHVNLGSILTIFGRPTEALASFRTALKIDPFFFVAHSNLLLVQNFLDDSFERTRLIDAKRYGDLVTQQARAYTSWPNSPDPARCLRVGFVSADLRAHPVGYFLEAAIAALASRTAGQVVLFAYATLPGSDEITDRIRSHFHTWNEVSGLTDEALARRIRTDGIDILIDLSGHAASNRLSMFAWKPAPVQVSWLGYFATTGVPAIDYFIADAWSLPASEESNFTETIWRLPETRLCFTPPAPGLQVGPLPAISRGYLTFGCFNNLTKMNDAVVALWARILTAVPNSRLFLMAPQLSQLSMQQSVIERFSAHGIGAEYLKLSGSVPRAEYLKSYNEVDIALDPFPYTGGTTTVEALWMGVPTLTMAGKSLLSRQGVGLMMNAALPDWVVPTPEDYVHRAISHANDLRQLATLRAGLRQQVQASPIFDAPRFAGHFEAVLRGMWVTWCANQASRE